MTTKLVEHIFKEKYRARVTQKELAIDRRDVELPEFEFETDKKHTTTRHGYFIIDEERDSIQSQLLLGLINGDPMTTGYEDADAESIDLVFEAEVTINTLVEINYFVKRIILCNFTDAPIIQEKLEQYLEEIEMRTITDLYYKRPPADDIKKMEALIATLNPLSEMTGRLGKDTSSWGELEKLFGTVVTPINPSIVMSQDGSVEVSNYESNAPGGMYSF